MGFNSGFKGLNTVGLSEVFDDEFKNVLRN